MAWLQETNIRGPQGAPGPAADNIRSTPADMYVGFKTGPNRVTFNDKVDGTGAEVAALDEIGNFTTTGIRLTYGNGAALIAYQNTSQSVDFYKMAGASSFRFLKSSDGKNTGTGITLLMSVLDTGQISMPGSPGLTCVGPIVAGQNISSSSANLALGCTGAGQVILRPNGVASGTGQAILNAAGDLALLGGLSVAGAVTGAGFTPFAKLASPVFTGDPQAPTPATADNDTSIATTAFVKSAISAAGSVATVAAAAPASPATGQIWWNSTTKELTIWDGTAWQVVVGTWA